jgi:hypothetical protein
MRFVGSGRQTSSTANIFAINPTWTATGIELDNLRREAATNYLNSDTKINGSETHTKFGKPKMKIKFERIKHKCGDIIVEVK